MQRGYIAIVTAYPDSYLLNPIRSDTENGVSRPRIATWLLEIADPNGKPMADRFAHDGAGCGTRRGNCQAGDPFFGHNPRSEAPNVNRSDEFKLTHSPPHTSLYAAA
jgi:hypothetical protein